MLRRGGDGTGAETVMADDKRKRKPGARRPKGARGAAKRPGASSAGDATEATPAKSAKGAKAAKQPQGATKDPRSDYEKLQDDLRRNMLRSIITEPLLGRIHSEPNGTFDVIISLNELYKGGLEGALDAVRQRAAEWKVQGYQAISNYVFAHLTGEQIKTLAVESQKLNMLNKRDEAVVYRIWEDADISVSLTRSLTTVKADAAQRSFHAVGEGIVWAVLDSGIDGTHVHFEAKTTLHGRIDTLAIRAPVEHRDYTPDGAAALAGEGDAASGEAASGAAPSDRPGRSTALTDRLGHGSHVAGIIGGFWTSDVPGGEHVVGTEVRDETADAGSEGIKAIHAREPLTSISGVAPLCRLVSLKVIADVTRDKTYRQRKGQGKVSWVLRAIDDIQRWNQNGKRILVHGVNMSLGYEFDPRWFGCGQSPLCAEVNRLVKSGVCVVVSAGNSGYSSYISGSGKELNSYNAQSITDPGNAEFAITVGSTHRDMPHTYGVSYFSSRGPTGDGRRKPDLLAPGERIRSCAAGDEQDRYGVQLPIDAPDTGVITGSEGPGNLAPSAVEETDTAASAAATATAAPPRRAPENGKVLYCEQTGTSMAAPHVSGAIAAFLSVRTEFIGQPERVKALFLANAIDLGREPSFQGNGLLDLMKVLQAV
jgi:subtilisin family serine protease